MNQIVENSAMEKNQTGGVFEKCWNFRVAKEGIPQRWHLSKTLKDPKKQDLLISGGDVFQAEGTANAKRWDDDMSNVSKNSKEDSGWNPGQKTFDPRKSFGGLVWEGSSTTSPDLAGSVEVGNPSGPG